MIYLLFVLIALVSVCLIEVFAARMGVLDFGEKIKLYKISDDKDIIPYKGKKLILITILCSVILLAVQISLYKNTIFVSFLKLYFLVPLVICAGLIDYKRRIIPNLLIIIGLIFRAVIYVYEILFTENFKEIFINDMLGFVIGFVFLGFISFVSKGALGFGDAKLFGIIGITTGGFCTYSTLLLSLVLSVVVSFVNIARKKMKRKDSFPFGPCIAVGYVIAILLTSY